MQGSRGQSPLELKRKQIRVTGFGFELGRTDCSHPKNGHNHASLYEPLIRRGRRCPARCVSVFFFSLPAFSRKVGKLVGKIATFYYGLDSCRYGKLSRENNSLETCSREKDVAP